MDLGARSADVPRTWAALTAQLDRINRAGTLRVGPDARDLARAVLSPPFSILTGPFGWTNRLSTTALLPPDVREQYGLAWDSRQARHYARIARILRRTRAALPKGMARWKDTQPSSARASR